MFKIGVLALQGGYDKHCIMLKNLNVIPKYIKYKNDLEDCSGLIIPGGESTTLSKLIIKNNLYNDLRQFSETNPIFGTCAGLIMLSNLNNNHVKALNLLNIDIERNGWGPQINSFSVKVKLSWEKKEPFNALFIRAPKINHINDKNINVLASVNSEPILIKYKNLLGSTFHPELTFDNRIHKYFLKMIYDN